jgi:hypothetical protein|eukprot:COSAG01_NODE_18517_length_1071_cov_0.840535_2_plen_59_part_00
MDGGRGGKDWRGGGPPQHVRVACRRTASCGGGSLLAAARMARFSCARPMVCILGTGLA